MISDESKIVEDFHKLYYDNGSRTWSGNTKYLGINILKCPLDLWIYQEIVYKIKPDIIIEIGSGDGGCSLFLAHILDAIFNSGNSLNSRNSGNSLNSRNSGNSLNSRNSLNNGTIIAIDTENKNHFEKLPKHNRIKYVTGKSVSEETVSQVRQIIKFPIKSPMLVILDSDHHKVNVLEELNIYSQFTIKDSYIVVEDTNLNHPMPTDFEGPYEAVQEFLSENDTNNNKKFIIDKEMEKFYLTFNPSGYLKRV